VLRRYDHLINRNYGNATPSIVPDPHQTEENCRNAHGINSPVCADDRSRRNAAGHSAQDQFA
jgi:hypothetical protein